MCAGDYPSSESSKALCPERPSNCETHILCGLLPQTGERLCFPNALHWQGCPSGIEGRVGCDVMHPDDDLFTRDSLPGSLRSWIQP